MLIVCSFYRKRNISLKIRVVMIHENDNAFSCKKAGNIKRISLSGTFRFRRLRGTA